MLTNTTLFINCMQGYSHVGFSHTSGAPTDTHKGPHPTPRHPCPYDPRLLGEPPCRCVGGTRRGLAHPVPPTYLKTYIFLYSPSTASSPRPPCLLAAFSLVVPTPTAAPPEPPASRPACTSHTAAR